MTGTNTPALISSLQYNSGKRTIPKLDLAAFNNDLPLGQLKLPETVISDFALLLLLT